MGHIGFSYVGLCFLILLMIPNLIWTKNKPEGYTPQNENKILAWFENIGEVLVTCAVLMFSDFNPEKWSLWSLWLIAAGILMLMYELWWIRYFKSKQTLKCF